MFGVSNIPLIEYLHDIGAVITVFHNKSKESIDVDIVTKIESYGIQIECGDNYLAKLHGFYMIFRSPSCRPDIPEIIKAVEDGAILTSEVEMLLKLCPAKTIGITGSDGKTTTTTLIYEILKKQGYNCFLGGNIGTPLFTKIDEMRPQDIVILELSSFQLMNMEISPNIAVITNITPNHLDIHKSYEEYIESKANIFKNQREDDILVLNYDDDIVREFKNKARGKVVFFSIKEKLEDGVILDNNTIKICKDGLRRHLLNIKDMKLRGIHNAQNSCTAVVATMWSADVEKQVEIIKTFPGVNHRLEFVREIDGTRWYNDSIGSSPTRTIAGLKSFDEKIVLIAGGYDKHLDYEPIAVPIIENVSKLILMGATAEKIQDVVLHELEAQKNEMEIYRVNSLEEAVQKAKEVSTPEEIVLFSPASASFDMFKNFEERGNKFKEIVNNIK